MPDRNYIELTKKLIGSNRYGKFDLIDKIISPQKLLQEKTRVLKCELMVLLDIPAEDFPAKSFKVWVCRYRKEHAINSKSFQNKEKRYEKAEIEKIGIDNKITGKNGGWLSFQPTDPATLKKDTEPILVKVLPNKNHNT